MVGSMAKQLAARPDKPVPYYQAFDCSDIFQGMAIETDTDNCDTLRALDGVVNVWSMKTIPMTPDINKSTIEPLTKFHNYSMHQWTGVDKLHAAGIRGKGVTVAIVDTGIDYTHKAVSIQASISSSATNLCSLEAASGQVARSRVAMILLALPVSTNLLVRIRKLKRDRAGI